MKLIRYENACRALAEAKAVDEAKEIHNRAEAMRVYAMQAKNKTLEVDAAEIRIRAERRLGELISAQKESVGLNPGGQPRKAKKNRLPPVTSTFRPLNDDYKQRLSDVGIPKRLSARAQKLAAVPEPKFEGLVGEWRDRVEAEGERVTTKLLKEGTKAQKKAQDDGQRHIAELEQENAELKERLSEMQNMLPELQALASAADAFKEDQGFKRLHNLEIENQSIKRRRDEAMREAVEAKRTAKYWRREAEKLGWKAKGNGSAMRGAA